MLLSVIIPAYNEANTIAHVIQAVEAVDLRPLGLEKEIIIVDDGSTDQTPEVLKSWDSSPAVRLHRHEQNRGKGSAQRTGLGLARGDIILFQDADLEWNPQDYPPLLQPIVNGQADIVYGSRFLSRSRPATISLQNYWANLFLSRLSSTLNGLKISDLYTGYKVFRAAALKGLVIRESRFGIEVELTAWVARQIKKSNYRYLEVPVGYTARDKASGKKIGWKDGFRALLCLLKYNRSSS